MESRRDARTAWVEPWPVTWEPRMKRSRGNLRPAPECAADGRVGGTNDTQRWRQIDDLFDASLRLGPDERDAWLRARAERTRASGRGFAPPCPGCERRPGRFHAASGGSERASWLDGELASPGQRACRNCDRLVWFERYQDVVKAITREKELKGWRRTRKIALIESINPAWTDLSRDWYDCEPADYRRALDRMDC